MLVAPAFQTYAFLQVVVHAGDLGEERLKYIEDETPENSNIQLFAAAMKTWRMESRRRRFWQRRNTLHLPEPRRFNIEHWSSPCGRDPLKRVTYFHANQVTYPPSPSTRNSKLPAFATPRFFFLTNFSTTVVLLITCIALNATINLHKVVISRHCGNYKNFFGFRLFAEVLAMVMTTISILHHASGPKPGDSPACLLACTGIYVGATRHCRLAGKGYTIEVIYLLCINNIHLLTNISSLERWRSITRYAR